MEFIVGTLLAVIGLLVMIIIALYQERSPKISVECSPLPDGNPCVLDCVVRNSGKKTAENIYVGFTNMLPLDTKVFASPEAMVEIIESEQPPDPTITPNIAMLTKAFVIHVPRIAPKDKIVIQIRTINSDNQRAAKQILKIREESVKILQAFGKRLMDVNPKEAKKWDIESIINGRIKSDNLFAPGNFSYSEGRFPIKFFSEDEIRARALNQDLYSRYKASFIDIYQNRKEFKAPVVRIKTEEGERTYAIFPPYIKTYVEAQVPVSQIKKHGQIIVYPPIPTSYE